jgi:pimeloyl-ACP methyl ester carboxylesterase
MMKTLFTIVLLVITQTSFAREDTLSINLEGVDYGYPVKYLGLKTEGQDLRMAYLDVKPSAKANGKTVMLFHGKNFGGYYWKEVVAKLLENGYRVLVPDQIGFGKSSKAILHYSFHEMARNNKALMDTLGIDQAYILGHSMGGMLATRFALMYPERTVKLFLENPIGLEDYRQFVPYRNAEENYSTELKKTAASIKAYYENSYFPVWKPDYDYLVEIGAGPIFNADYPRFAMVSALTAVMIFEQPVVHEFKNIKVPTVLFIGTKDHTIVGKNLLSKTEQAKYGQYKTLGKETAANIPGAKLVEFEGVGHIPHIEVLDDFMKALLSALKQ